MKEKELRELVKNALGSQKIWERNDALKSIIDEFKKNQSDERQNNP